MKAKMKTYLHHPGSLVVLLLTILSAVITVAARFADRLYSGKGSAASDTAAVCVDV